ncbi:MAG: cytochrome c oxidase subunit 4 [Microbacteriaceae bacterium]
MRINTNLFWVIGIFFFVEAITYVVWGLADPFHHSVEWVGTVTLTLCGILGTLIAYYLGRTRKAQGEELPEDRQNANIDDGDAEQGHFSPWSWWPILLAGSAGLVFMGLAIGSWIAFIGVPLALVSLVGWVYEYYRGYFAH